MKNETWVILLTAWIKCTPDTIGDFNDFNDFSDFSDFNDFNDICDFNDFRDTNYIVASMIFTNPT